VKKLQELTAHESHDLLKSRQVSSVELTKAVLDQIDAVEPRIQAYLTVTADHALARAADIDRRRAAGEQMGPLAGVPMALKDNMCTKGIRTTCASKMLDNFLPPYDATVTSKLIEAGSVMVGKTNLDEFAMGSSTENSAYQTTRNPWDTERVPGGSSGGSAASVAAHEAMYSLGSDTGGSIRLPASFCGIVGLKPTYGRVSRYGLVAFGSSLDQIGPLTKDVTDCALVMNAICGRDRMDATSVAVDVPDFTKSLIPDLKGFRLGVPREYFEGMDESAEAVLRQAIDQLIQAGATVEETSLPHTKYALASYYIIAPAEASANLARYDGVKYGHSDRNVKDIWEMFSKTREEGFGPEVKRRIMIGTYALSSGYYEAYYLKAQKARAMIRQDFVEAFQKFNAILTPTSPTVAFKIGEKTGNPLAMYLSDVATVTVNPAGIPGISVPCGMADSMPVGLQILGNYFDEGSLLRIGYTLEQSLKTGGGQG
jgi:aspartyl-tRNA(Asn)/glutamyl-tRNA(Gln) amidotransferase subunit A